MSETYIPFINEFGNKCKCQAERIEEKLARGGNFLDEKAEELYASWKSAQDSSEGISDAAFTPKDAPAEEAKVSEKKK